MIRLETVTSVSGVDISAVLTLTGSGSGVAARQPALPALPALPAPPATILDSRSDHATDGNRQVPVRLVGVPEQAHYCPGKSVARCRDGCKAAWTSLSDRRALAMA